jgi:hypothetical protein
MMCPSTALKEGGMEKCKRCGFGQAVKKRNLFVGFEFSDPRFQFFDFDRLLYKHRDRNGNDKCNQHDGRMDVPENKSSDKEEKSVTQNKAHCKYCKKFFH